MLCCVMEISTSAFYVWIKKPGDADKIRKKKCMKPRRASFSMNISKPVAIGGYLMRWARWGMGYYADHMRTALCVSALQIAFWCRKPEPGLLHYSDRGSQYASHEYREHLSIMKMEQSIAVKEIVGITPR